MTKPANPAPADIAQSLPASAGDEHSLPTPESRFFAADANVMAGYSSYYHTKEFPVIDFGDDCWDFSVMDDTTSRPHRGYKVDFAAITNPAWRLAAKEVCLALLHPQHPKVDVIPQRRVRPAPLKTPFTEMRLLKHWFEWLETQGVEKLTDVAQEHCDSYLAARLQEMTPTSAVSAVVLPVRNLAVYRTVLTETYADSFTPWRKRKTAQITGVVRRSGNSTPWIPEQVFEPLLAGALFYVQRAARDIIAAQRELEALPKATPMVGAEKKRTRLLAHLEALRATGGSLPAHEVWNVGPRPYTRRGVVGSDGDDPLANLNFYCLGRLANASFSSEKLTEEEYEMLVSAAQEFGVKPGGFLSRASDVERPDGTTGPWRDGFGMTSAKDELQRLRAACFVVIAGLTGMRPAEALDIRRDCVEEVETGDGQKRLKVHSRVYKKRVLGGDEDTWTVVEPVVEAIRVLEALAPEANRSPTATLWSITGGKPPIHEIVGSFQEWQNGAGGRQAGLPMIPEVDGEPWHYNAQQFRRTLARQLAFRPHGTIASKVHLKHIAVAITEGYWGPEGESAERFLEEVGEQEREARQANVLRKFHDWETGGRISGGASKKLVQDFALAAGELEGFQGTVEQRDKRILELLRADTETLHIGLINDCHFNDPSKARCLKSRGVNTDGATAPIIAACDPSRCANAVITAEHAPRWNQSLIQIDSLMANRGIPGRERERLAEEKARLEKIVEPFQTGTKPTKGKAAKVEAVKGKAVKSFSVVAKQGDDAIPERVAKAVQ